MNCPECGRDDAVVTSTIRYPRGNVTLILNCPHCVRLVLADGKSVAAPTEALIY